MARDVLAVVLLAAGAVLANEPLRRMPPWLPRLAPAIRGGLLPVLAAGVVVAAVTLLARRRGATRLEAIQAAFTFAVAAFAVLTVAGVLFRGQGMALAWPWTARAGEIP
jgi:hypothetical protein